MARKKKATGVDADRVEEKESKPKKEKHYYVCKGVTLTSKNRLLHPGDCLCENDLSGGKKSLEYLLNKDRIELR